MERVLTELPEREDLAAFESWELLDHESPTVVQATFLGLGSSERLEHDDHAGVHAGPTELCGKCRWMEIRLFRTAEGEYVVAYVKATDVPGEADEHWLYRSMDVAEVVETLIRPPRRSTPSEQALFDASSVDPDVREAYREFLGARARELREDLDRGRIHRPKDAKWASAWVSFAAKTLHLLARDHLQGQHTDL